MGRCKTKGMVGSFGDLIFGGKLVLLVETLLVKIAIITMSKSNAGDAAECPKRPPNAYFRFLAENRDSVKGDGFREKMKELWENFDPKKKAQYEQEYKEQMDQYKKDMETWKSKGG